MTYSMIARDPKSGALGAVVQSAGLAIGATVPHVRANVGTVVTQAWVDPSHGPRILELLHAGAGAHDALTAVLADDEWADYRQIAVVDARGSGAVHTGARCFPHAGSLAERRMECAGQLDGQPRVMHPLGSRGVSGPRPDPQPRRNHADALAAFDQALRLAPGGADPLYWAALGASAAGDLDLAVRRARAALALDPRLEVLLERSEDSYAGVTTPRRALGRD
jgi:tetratricopeptide (TPR) repeat protein